MAKKRKAKVRAKPKAKRITARKAPAKRRPASKKKGAKKAPRKTAGKKAVRRAAKGGEALALEKIGEVTHYFPKVKAAAVKIMKGTLAVGATIRIKGHTTDFEERVGSIQLDHITIDEGRQGQEIGLLVRSRVRAGDTVYRI